MSALSLSKNTEGFSEIRAMRLNKILICLVGVHQSAIEDSEYAVGHCWRSLIWYSGLIVS